jgi:hypothetical protein
VGLSGTRSPTPHFLESDLECIVPKKPQNNKKEKFQDPKNQPWISMRRGIVMIAFTSVALAILTAWQVSYSRGWLEGILWGLLFGALIWIIFFGNLFITRLLRK